MGSRATPEVSAGAPEPLGAMLTATGANFAVWSAHAEAVEICLFDPGSEIESRRVRLPGRTGDVFHGEIAGVGPGARYGLRVHGPFDPARGHRFNPNKLLVDPYALALDRSFALHPAMFGSRPDDPRDGAAFDPTDSADVVPKALVVAPPEACTRPRPARPWGGALIYELNVRGFTRLNPEIPAALRGTFAALGHPAAIAHLTRLGVTSVELMPAAAWIDERHLPPLGLTNAWGYNPVALMVPDPRLAPGGWAEVRAATDALAAAGIETILDVVLNHTGEGDALGPTLSLRGLDNANYYRLQADDPAGYVNDAGTGNILALDHPAALRLAMDALRAWARFGGVDGFRFDLATVLGRRREGFDPHAPLIAAIAQDPDLRALKLIAEPWDCGPGGYQLGRFPPAWGEWNDRFRDSVRSFWRDDAVSVGELASRLAGSRDLFAGRPPSRGVNFVVAHDGFTLADLVAYRSRDNLANGEDNRDGESDNRSWNNGVEGPTDDPAVLRARLADQRALLATLFVARGTPMLPMGAETGRTQGGNNNAYAQDNPIGWLDWAGADPGLLAFTARLAAIRRDHPALHADHWLEGWPADGCADPDVAWTRPDGQPLAPQDWDDPQGASLVMVLAAPGPDGQDRVAVALHRGPAAVDLRLPAPSDGRGWAILADSADDARLGALDDGTVRLAPRSVLILAESPAPDRRLRPTDPTALARLATAAGIGPEWFSLAGERHAVGPDTLRALLAAMNLPAETTQQARESLDRLSEEDERRPLPFSLAVRSGDPITIPLRFGADAPPPRSWLQIAGDGGQTLRMRAAADLGAVETGVGVDGRPLRRLLADLPPLDAGRYEVRREDLPDAVCHLTVAPPACFLPGAVAQERRLLALSSQIYALRRAGDQGVGDFTTLGALGAAAADRGFDALGVNPLHALFNERRDRASPYYPSDRRFLDPLYLDLAVVSHARVPPGARRLHDAARIDHAAVWALKAEALADSFAAMSDPGLDAFVRAGGAALRRFAVFQAISESRPQTPWTAWPAELRDPESAGVEAFARAHPERVRFHQYLQWLCEAQFASAAQAAGGLELGICRDLAVGAAPDGAECWAWSRLLARGVSIGAPPDAFAPQGQVWGLPPFDPRQVGADGRRAYAELFAANMRHAGALRIDHALGLARQFWVPDGAEGLEGAYVAFPLHDLLGELALESVRARCLVIGEDLGTVPEGLGDVLAANGVLGYRVLPFERENGGFKPPAAYARLAWACVGTHDLPPLAGWWRGVDIDESAALGLTGPGAVQARRAERDADRRALVEALAAAGLIEPGTVAEGLTPQLAAAIHAFVARTPSLLAAIQVEDLAGEVTAINLPGTDRERPNWRKRIATPLESLFDRPGAQALIAAMREAGRGAARPDSGEPGT